MLRRKFNKAGALSNRRHKGELRSREGEVAVEFECSSQELLGLQDSTLIPPVGPKRACGLVVATLSVDILGSLAPNKDEFRLAQSRIHFEYYSA